MIETSGHICCAGAASKRRVHLHLQRFCGPLVLVLLLGVWPARADGPDDEYLQIYGLIQTADELNADGKAAPAKTKYLEAKAALTSFQTNYPYWNVKLVSYRLNYLAQKVAPPAEKPPIVAEGATQTSTMQVKLIEAGAEPRKVLRLHPKPGDKQTLDLSLKMAVETKVGEMEPPATKLPEIKMSLEATVKSVADNGDITYEMVMGDIGVSEEPGAAPMVAEAIKSALAGVKGMSGSGTTSSRGFSKGFEFKAPSDSNPQARQVVDQMKDSFTEIAALLPEEAVGTGAKWEVKLPIKSQGMTIDQTSTYELVSLEGEIFKTKSTIVQQAANQKIQNPAMPGIKVDLTKMTGKGNSERTFDLSKLLPTAGTGRVHTETAMSMNMGGQKQAMTMKMDMDVRIETR
jgi:hypothetical protein